MLLLRSRRTLCLVCSIQVNINKQAGAERETWLATARMESDGDFATAAGETETAAVSNDTL